LEEEGNRNKYRKAIEVISLIDNECQISSQTQSMQYVVNSLTKENIFGLELYKIRNLLMFV